jgi:hypothetical protein
MADLTAVPWNRFPREAAPADQVSAHFRFYELTKSDAAARHGIDNAFADDDCCRAAVYLCREVLEPVRLRFGRYSPNSVFRCQATERALKGKDRGWTSTSQHTLGRACDIEVPGLANIELAQWIAGNLAFDQIILECYNAREGANSGWVHVSLVPPGKGINRRQLLSYVLSERSGRYAYVQGLRETV